MKRKKMIKKLLKISRTEELAFLEGYLTARRYYMKKIAAIRFKLLDMKARITGMSHQTANKFVRSGKS